MVEPEEYGSFWVPASEFREMSGECAGGNMQLIGETSSACSVHNSQPGSELVALVALGWQH